MPPERVNQVAKEVGADLRRRRRGRRTLPPTPRTRRGATRTEGGRTTSGSGSGSGTSMRPWKSLAGSAPATKSQTSRWRSWGSSTTLLTSSWPSSNRSGRETSTRKWLAFSAKRRAQVRCCRTPPTDSHHQPHFTPRAASHPSPPRPLLFCNSCWDILVQNMVFLGKLQCLFACCHCGQTNRQKGKIFLYKQIFVISRCGATIVLRQVEVLIKSGGNNSKGASCQSEHWSNVSRL